MPTPPRLFGCCPVRALVLCGWPGAPRLLAPPATITATAKTRDLEQLIMADGKYLKAR